MITVAPQIQPVQQTGDVSARLRRVFAEFTTGVAVVTSATPRGPVGMTVNSFTSVSLDPPLILVCLANSALTTRVVTEAGSFAISILCRNQRPVCDNFARCGHDKFRGVGANTAATGAPVIDGALAYIDCRVYKVLAAGDHLVVIGAVAEAATLSGGEPLTFFRGRLS